MSDQTKSDLNSNCWPPSEETGGRQDDAFRSKCVLNHLNSDEFTSAEFEQIRKTIREKYAEVSISAEGKFQYLTGKEGAEALGYEPSILKDIQPELLNAFCGVGNPFSIGEIKQGSVILDIGSGAGFDLIVASRLTGPGGRVYGIDLTKEMIARAKENIEKIGASNVEITHVNSEEIPFGDNMFDVVISNGVINLSPCKKDLFKEINRVLKPGGQLQFADIIEENELPSRLTGSLEAWSQWIGGTIPVRDQINLMKQAGFSDVEYLGATGTRTSKFTIGALFRAVK